MKTPRPTGPRRSPKDTKSIAKLSYDQALHACEEAAAGIQSASNDLVASWAALSRELASGASATDLLRKRAWCNVLELRLKEQTRALEGARQVVDRLWDDMLISRRARELFNRFVKKNIGDDFAGDAGLSLLSRTASAIAAEHGSGAQLKK